MEVIFTRQIHVTEFRLSFAKFRSNRTEFQKKKFFRRFLKAYWTELTKQIPCRRTSICILDSCRFYLYLRSLHCTGCL
jgi:hypothetical protein